MPRPRKLNKVPMTSISISESLVKEMSKHKPYHKTWSDYIHDMFYAFTSRGSLSVLKEENEFLVQTLEETRKKCEEYATQLKNK